MSTYKVTSDRLQGFDLGAVVEAKDLDGLNIDALIAGGHLEASANTKPVSQPKETTKES